MNIVQITPGAGGMYCGGCFRDNALVSALRKLGHETLMVPLYLPLTLDEADQSSGTPIFFSGINVFLQQKLPWFRNAPFWLRDVLASPSLLKLVGTRAARTRAEDVGDLTVSMLRGEEGRQARELDELIAWLKQQLRPDVVVLSNALLVGLARRLHEELGAPVLCLLAGEDAFLDGLPGEHRGEAWRTISARAQDVDLFIAPSRYFGELMAQRLKLAPDRVSVISNGINLEGFTGSARPLSDNLPETPVLGYFARMCREKGLELAVEVFLELKKRGRVPGLKFHVGGGCGPGDEPFVAEQKEKLARAGVAGDVSFFPNVSRDEKIAFLRGIDVFCTPALYGEAFGLYVIEAMAAGVPVVQPNHAAFPEILESTGGGVVTEPNAVALASVIEELFLDPERRRTLSESGLAAVRREFSIEHMAENFARVCRERAARFQPVNASIS